MLRYTLLSANCNGTRLEVTHVMIDPKTPLRDGSVVPSPSVEYRVCERRVSREDFTAIVSALALPGASRAAP